MEQFRRNADRLGLCDTFAQKWSACRSKKQLYDLACDVNSLAYLADMIARGYGLSPEYLLKEFGQFLNGKCIYNKDGYSSCIYCLPEECEIRPDTTACLIICHDGEIVVDRPICELYLVYCDCIIRGNGIAKVHLYNSSIVNPDERIIVESQKEY